MSRSRSGSIFGIFDKLNKDKESKKKSVTIRKGNCSYCNSEIQVYINNIDNNSNSAKILDNGRFVCKECLGYFH